MKNCPTMASPSRFEVIMKIGDKISFVPHIWRWSKVSELTPRGLHREPRRVEGRIIYINTAHRICRVQYMAGGIIQHECFKIQRCGGRGI